MALKKIIKSRNGRPEGRTDIPKGAMVRITVPQNEDLPGGWANVKSMIHIGEFIEYSYDGVRIQFDQDVHMGTFWTEAWCIEVVQEDNEGYVNVLKPLPKELEDGNICSPIGI